MDGKFEILLDLGTKKRLFSYGGLGTDGIQETQTRMKTKNYPNPFIGSTTIEYYIDNPKSSIKLNIFNQTGQLIFSQNIGIKESGIHKVVWNAKDNNGNNVTSGIYYYSIVQNGIKGSKTMIKL